MNEKMSNAFRRIADIRWRGFRKSESRLGFRELDWEFWRPEDYGFGYFKFPLDVVEKAVVLGYIS